MIIRFQDKLKAKELQSLRYLNVVAAVIVTSLGFLFEFLYHDGYILITGLLMSMVMTANYFLSFYSSFFRQNFSRISEASVFLLQVWAVFVAYQRNFEIVVLLPVCISIFTFALIFDRFFKSLLFIFTLTTFMLGLMLASGNWQPQFTVALAALYAGAFLADQIQKRKEFFHREIEKQEGRYISLVENMNDGMIYAGADGFITFVNDQFSSITGIGRAEVTGKRLEEIIPVSGFAEEMNAGHAVRVQAIIRRKNGEEVTLQVNAAPDYNEDGDRIGTLAVCTDITGLKRIQEQLKKQEEGYRTFIDQSSIGIWRAEYRQPIPLSLPVEDQVELLLDTGIITECNDFMAKMYGHSSSFDLIGRRIRDFYYIESNLDKEKTDELLRSFVRNNYRISNAESKEQDRFGNVRYMLNNNIGIVEDGYLVRTWGVQADITDRKNTERELSETNRELDTFFYKASHDLKGPLASVMGIVNLGRMENKDQVIDQYFNMIELSVKRLDRTLMDLIELARTRKGSSKLSLININAFVAEILHSLEHLPSFPRIRFDVRIDPEIEMLADKVLLQSVFQNLIHNAINYCNQQAPIIRIAVNESDNHLELEVTDNGNGIPDKIRPRVFDMFYRGHPDSSGSGLGLFIVKNALDKMKGSIRFDSQSGRGTSFYVTLPRTLIEA